MWRGWHFDMTRCYSSAFAARDVCVYGRTVLFSLPPGFNVSIFVQRVGVLVGHTPCLFLNNNALQEPIFLLTLYAL